MSTAPLARNYWVAHDPTPAPAASAAWSDLLAAHLAGHDALEIVHGTGVVARDCGPRLLKASLAEQAHHARRALVHHEAVRDQPIDERPLCPEERWLLAVLHRHGAALDSAVGVLGAFLCGARLSATESLYPSEMTLRLLGAPLPGRAPQNRYVPRIAARLSRARPDPWRVTEEWLVALRERLRAGAWPEPEAARCAVEALMAIEAAWDEAGMLEREAERSRGKLASDRRRDLQAALSWCRTTRHVLVRLASPTGWLRLLLDYLLEIRAGAARIIDEARPDCPTSTFIDVVMHELAHALIVVDGDQRTAVAALRDRVGGGDAARMRLSRGRQRCLAHWTAHEPDPEWDDEDFLALLAGLAQIFAAERDA